MLVSVSGIDGGGKSTQIELLMRALSAGGFNPRYLWARGGYTPLFNRLKSFLRTAAPKKGLVPASGHSLKRDQMFTRPIVRKLWITMAILDLAALYGVKVRWWVLRGRTIVCDRYLWDTLIDFELNFPGENVRGWLLWRALQFIAPLPEVQLLIMIPVTESLRRSDLKGEPFRDSRAVLEKRYARYLQLSERPGIRVIDGLRPREAVANEIAGIVLRQLPGHPNH